MDVAQINHQNIIYNQNSSGKKDKSSTANSYETSSEISGLSKSLSESNIDLLNSQISSGEDIVSFNLKFLKDTMQNLSLEGFFAKDYSRGEFAFQYDYKMGEEQSALTYKVQFSLSFNSIQSVSIPFGEEKEDLLTFLRRITREVFKKIKDGKHVVAFKLDQSDLEEINQMADKKLVQFIYMLIDRINLAIGAQKITNKEGSAHNVVYNPHRRINNTFHTEINAGNKVNCTFSASRINQGNSPA